MKENIKSEIKELLSDKKAREAIDIIKSLGYGKDLDTLVMECIQEMTNEYDLYVTKHNRYMNFNDSEATRDFVKGFFQTTKGEYGFVIVSDLDEDIYIPGDSKNSAMNGDLVLVKITKGEINDKKCEGKIIKVLKRSNEGKVGEVVINNHKTYVHLVAGKNKDLIYLTGDTSRLVDGDLVTLELIDSKNYPTAEFIKRIGHKNDPGSDIEVVLAENGFDTEFPEDVIEELKTIPTEVSSEEIKGRKDFRGKMIFTIDGDDTKDIDDAISLEKLANGNYQLGVHIADVSHYVKEDSPLDKEARKRGTSVYLADRVVPMLPHQLSNGICSLNPNVDRLTLSCIMEIDAKGNLVNYDIFESVINSKKQMTYKNVNKIIEEGEIPSDYEEFASKLQEMKELADIVRKNKINKGYVDFDVLESKIIVDDEANVKDIQIRYRGAGEKLIEDFMILANEAVATYIGNCNLPSVYRVHGNVNDLKLRKFINILGILGVSIKENLNNVNQKTIQRIIATIKEKRPDCFQVLSTYMISCMAKAKYQTENIGHFALALRNYTHFTSPIRRYPDLTIHRLIHNYFFNINGLLEDVINHFDTILNEICLTSSEREVASIKCEREVDDMKMAEYMEQHIGEVYPGIVSGITSFGMFVMLENGIEGMIRYDSFDERMIYDSEKEMLIGFKTKRIFTIGSKLDVKVVKASKELRQIDFEEEKVDKYEKEENTKIKTKR